MLTIANAEAALKDYYLDAVNAQLNAEVSPLFNAITKTNENVFGKDVKISIARNSMEGIVAGTEDGDLPSPRANRYTNITLPLKNIYGTIEISDKALRASADSTGAFVNLLNAEIEGLISSAKANFARMLYGNGDGMLCMTLVKKSSHVIQVNNVKSYFKGLKVTLYTTPSVTTTITNVDLYGKTVTLEADLSSITVDGCEDIGIAGASNKELSGLAKIFDNSGIYGIKKSDDDYFNPYRKVIAASKLTEDDLINVIDTLEERCDGKVNMIVCSFEARKLIASLLSPARRIVNSTDIKSGYSSIYINDVPVYADKYCPDDRIYFLNTNDFVLNQLCDWSWLEDESGRILKQVPGKAAYSATLVKYAELVCKKPCGQGLVQVEFES